MKILTLRLKKKWWTEIRDGGKAVELRRDTAFYRRLLIGREYDEVHLWLGYPPSSDIERRLRFAWRGVAELPAVKHPEFGSVPVDLLGIDLTTPL